MSTPSKPTDEPWTLHNFGDATDEEGITGHAITCAVLGGLDHGIRIYLRYDDPLGHAREIVAALNEHEARKAGRKP